MSAPRTPHPYLEPHPVPAELDQGLCVTTPEGRALDWVPDSEQHVAEHKAVCAGCPVRVVCADYAIRSGVAGIWGETTTNERKRLRKAAGGPFKITVRVPLLDVEHVPSPSAYRRHLRRGEDPCQPCKDAEAGRNRWMAAQRRQAKEATA